MEREISLGAPLCYADYIWSNFIVDLTRIPFPNVDLTNIFNNCEEIFLPNVVMGSNIKSNEDSPSPILI